MTISEDDFFESDLLIQVTTDVVAAYVGNNKIGADELPDLIRAVHQTFDALGNDGAEGSGQVPAVPIDKSVTRDYVICLEDGKKLKMLKRYLRTHFDMTPEEYRAKWGLPRDYPMVAPSYSAKRSRYAKQIGLGKKPGTKRGRPKKKK